MAKNKNRRGRGGGNRSREDEDKDNSTSASGTGLSGKQINRQIRRERRGDEKHAEKESDKFYGEGSLGRLGDYGEVEGIGEAGQVSERSGTVNVRDVSAEDKAAGKTLSAREQEYEKSKSKDAYMQDALKRMQGGLGGYDAAENRALVEQAQAGGDEDSKMAMRQLQMSQGSAGQTGDAAMSQRAGILRNQALGRQMARQDVLGKNIAEKSRRLESYAGYGAQSKQVYDQARQGALDRLSQDRTQQQKLGLEAQQSNQAADVANQKAELGYNQLGQQGEEFNQDNAYRYGTANQDADMYNQNFARDTDVYNLGQQGAEKAGQVGTYYGDQAATNARRGQIESNQLTKRQLDIAEENQWGY